MESAPAAEPLVSIVLPVYNGARFLRQAMESCLEQTYRNIELIVVDDASTDETPEIIGSFDDARLVSVRNQRNLNLPASLNAGFARAGGEYLTWTSDDNYYAPRAIGKMVAFLRAREADFVCCDFLSVGDGAPKLDPQVRTPDLASLARDNCVGACFLYSRRVREAVGGYDPEAFLAEDYDYWIRVAKRFTMLYLQEPLYYYRYHAETLSARFARGRDVRVASILVRVKNGLTDAEIETRTLEALLARDRCRSGGAILKILAFLVRALSLKTTKLHWIVARFTKCPEGREVLRRFQAGEIGFAAARGEITGIFSGEARASPGPGRGAPARGALREDAGGASARRKLLFVTPRMTFGGAERVTAVLLRRLDVSRFEPVLAAFSLGNDYAGLLPSSLRQAVLCGEKERPPGSWRLAWRLARLIREERPAALLGVMNRAGYVASLAVRLARSDAKVIIAAHGVLGQTFRGSFRRHLRRRISRWAYRHADAVIAVSDGVRRETLALFGMASEDCVTIYNPLEIEAVREMAEEPAAGMSADGRPVIITGGRLTADKNVALLLRAFREVREQHPARLLILGDGPERPALEALSGELGLEGVVTFLGFQSNPFRYLAKAAVFALSSDKEGFPCTIQEAMACGVPVISSDCEYGPREIIAHGENGLLFPPGDRAALAAALGRLLGDAALRARLAENASRDVKRYDAKAVTKQYEELFDRVLDS